MNASPRGLDASAGRAVPLWSRPFLLACAVSTALILARSAVFWTYEQSFFDSDQAIVGLMAKHLAEGRAFPLFYYGQTYMLVVDAWIAAPIVWLFGPTVRALHGALVLMNVSGAALIVYGLTQYARLRPWLAVVAALFFTFAPPLTTASLIEAGANIGPFLYVPLLWFLRTRPLWFGLVLGVGVLNREFTIYAVPVLLAGDVVSRALFTRDRMRFWMVAAVSTLATWQGIQALKPYSDMMGPGTRGQLVRGDAGSQIGNASDRVAVVPSELPARARAMAFEHLPGLWGTRRLLNPIASQGRDWLFWPLTVSLTWCVVRVLWLRRRRVETAGDGSVAWYFAGVGIVAIAAYVATRPAENAVPRYLLLTLFAPIGITALHLLSEPRRWLRGMTVAIVLLWAGSSGADHLAQARRYWGGREPNEMRDLARALFDRQVTVATADYWMAYKLSYLTQERIVVASIDFVRIEEYQRVAQRAGTSVPRISDRPCSGGQPVSIWYLCRDDQ